MSAMLKIVETVKNLKKPEVIVLSKEDLDDMKEQLMNTGSSCNHCGNEFNFTQRFKLTKGEIINKKLLLKMSCSRCDTIFNISCEAQ